MLKEEHSYANTYNHFEHNQLGVRAPRPGCRMRVRVPIFSRGGTHMSAMCGSVVLLHEAADWTALATTALM